MSHLVYAKKNDVNFVWRYITCKFYCKTIQRITPTRVYLAIKSNF